MLSFTIKGIIRYNTIKNINKNKSRKKEEGYLHKKYNIMVKAVYQIKVFKTIQFKKHG